MTKVVQGIGDAIGDVVKGVVNVVKGVADGVGDLARSIADSPIGKAILIAGAVYFGGAALMGGLGESAAGGSFLSGMGAGVESAAGSLSSAWSATMAGDISGAAGYVGNAWGSAGTAGEMASAANAAAMGPSASLMSTGSSVLPSTAAPAASNVANFTAEQIANANSLAGQGANPTLNGLAGTTPPTPTSPFSLAQPPTIPTGVPPAIPPGAPPAAGWWAGVDPYLKTAAVMGGTQVVGGLISGAGQAKAAEDQRNFEVDQAELARQRRNKNMGAQLDFSAVRAAAAEKAAANPQTITQWDPQAAARALIAQYYSQAQPTGGVISKYMPGGTG